MGWGLACLALLIFAGTGYQSRHQSLLAMRRGLAETVSEDLAAALRGVENLPAVAVREARSVADDQPMTEGRLEELRSDLQPFCRAFWVPPGGEMGSEEPPLWLWSLARRRLPSDGAVTVLRPLPPGLEAGRVSPEALRLEEGTPARYLAAVGRSRGGDLFLVELDLDYVMGAWLKKRLERSPLGRDLTARPLGDVEPAPPAEVPPNDSDGELWVWRCPTFFAADASPFPPLVLTLDNGPVLSALRRTWAASVALAGGVMACLGLAIAATARAVRREVEFAQARTRFTAMVGHELRTPLSAISMYSEILREGLVEDPDKVVSYHALLAEQTRRLSSLVERVLTFARLEGDPPASELRLVPVAELTEGALRALGPAGARVRVVGVGDRERLRTDPDVVVQILANLLENALKHGGDQPPELEVVARPRGGFEFRVSDRGPGVAPEHRLKMFEAYQSFGPADRVPPLGDPKGRRAGLGLGLAIASRLAASLGGRLEYRDRDGGGASFCLILPGKEPDKHA